MIEGNCEKCGHGAELWILDGKWLCEDCCLDFEAAEAGKPPISDEGELVSTQNNLYTMFATAADGTIYHRHFPSQAEAAAAVIALRTRHQDIEIWLEPHDDVRFRFQ